MFLFPAIIFKLLNRRWRIGEVGEGITSKNKD
jgi:hypothetical protein